MPDLCCRCLGRKFVYSPGGRAPKLPCPICCKGVIGIDPERADDDPIVDDAALTDAEITAMADRAKRRLVGCNFTIEGNIVLACRESSGGGVAECEDEEIAAIISEALTSYYGLSATASTTSASGNEQVAAEVVQPSREAIEPSSALSAQGTET